MTKTILMMMRIALAMILRTMMMVMKVGAEVHSENSFVQYEKMAPAEVRKRQVGSHHDDAHHDHDYDHDRDNYKDDYDNDKDDDHDDNDDNDKDNDDDDDKDHYDDDTNASDDDHDDADANDDDLDDDAECSGASRGDLCVPNVAQSGEEVCQK